MLSEAPFTSESAADQLASADDLVNRLDMYSLDPAAPIPRVDMQDTLDFLIRRVNLIREATVTLTGSNPVVCPTFTEDRRVVVTDLAQGDCNVTESLVEIDTNTVKNVTNVTGLNDGTGTTIGEVPTGATTGSTLQFLQVTTAQRNQLVAVNGMVVYNTTDNEFQAYQAGSWQSFGIGGGNDLASVLATGNTTGANGIVMQNDVGITGDGYVDVRRDPGGVGIFAPANSMVDDRSQNLVQDTITLKLGALSNLFNFGNHGTMISFHGFGDSYLGRVGCRRTGASTGEVHLLASADSSGQVVVRNSSSIARVLINSNTVNQPGLLCLENYTGVNVYNAVEASTHGKLYCKDGQPIWMRPGGSINDEVNLAGAANPGEDVVVNTLDSGATITASGNEVAVALPASGSVPVVVPTPFAPGQLNNLIIQNDGAIGTGNGLTAIDFGDGSDVDRFGIQTDFTTNAFVDRDDWTVAGEQGGGIYFTVTTAGTVNLVFTPTGNWGGGNILVQILLFLTTTITL